MNALTNRLIAAVAHISFLVNLSIPPNHLRFINTTNAITVVIGVTKRNHMKKISTIVRRGQNGIRRSIGNEKRKTTRPSKQGKHQMNTASTFFRSRGNSSEVGMTDTSGEI